MKLLGHIFNSNSKSVSFGWTLSIAAHAFFALAPSRFSVENWTAAQAVAAGLIGIKSVKEGMNENTAIKHGKAPDAPAS